MQVAFAAAGFTVTADRMAVMNFTLSLDAQPYTFMFARPKQLSRALLFIQPYTPRVLLKQSVQQNLPHSSPLYHSIQAWVTIFAMTLATGPLVWIFNKISPYYEFHPQREGTPIFDLWYNTWYCIGAMLFQGKLMQSLQWGGNNKSCPKVVTRNIIIIIIIIMIINDDIQVKEKCRCLSVDV